MELIARLGGLVCDVVDKGPLEGSQRVMLFQRLSERAEDR